jgi:hypothetical protein
MLNRTDACVEVSQLGQCGILSRSLMFFLCRSRDDRVACCGTCRYFEEFGDRTTIANVSEYVLRGERYLSWSGSVVDDGI